MSAPAVITFFEVVGTAAAAKTMLEGVKEGNLTKAVLGGIGAAMGVSALGTAAGTAQGAEAAAEAAGGAAGAGGTEAVAAESLGGNIAAEEAGKTVAEQVAASGGTAPGVTVAETVAEEPSWMSKIGDVWSGAGDKTKSSLIELGGGLIKGYADEEMLKEMAAEKERLEAESRARRGYSAGGSILSGNRYNPTTHRWEPV